VGFTGTELYTYSNGPYAASAYAQWDGSGLDPNTLYDVCAYIPNDHADAHAQYHAYTYIPNGDGRPAPPISDSGALVVNQSPYSNQWALVGTFYPSRYGHIVVRVYDQSTDDALSTEVGADAMLFIPTAYDNQGEVIPGDGSALTTCFANG
jgi:hypothetical protein